jgi:meiotic recombination protein REC8
VLYGRDDSSSHGGGPARSLSQAEFELFGLAAQVDTQTAGDSQWVRDALNREADNFFDFVVNSISEKTGDELGEDGRRVAGKDMFVTFEELFEPARNSRVVAAQAFYHVLGLATKRRVWVEQDVGEEPFGEIRVGVVG